MNLANMRQTFICLLVDDDANFNALPEAFEVENAADSLIERAVRLDDVVVCRSTRLSISGMPTIRSG